MSVIARYVAPAIAGGSCQALCPGLTWVNSLQLPISTTPLSGHACGDLNAPASAVQASQLRHTIAFNACYQHQQKQIGPAHHAHILPSATLYPD